MTSWAARLHRLLVAFAPERSVASPQGPLRRRAGQVAPQHGHVARRQGHGLTAPLQELLGLPHEVLVRGVREGHLGHLATSLSLL